MWTFQRIIWFGGSVQPDSGSLLPHTGTLLFVFKRRPETCEGPWRGPKFRGSNKRGRILSRSTGPARAERTCATLARPPTTPEEQLRTRSAGNFAGRPSEKLLLPSSQLSSERLSGARRGRSRAVTHGHDADGSEASLEERASL